MKRAFFVSYGSYGDVFPFLAVAQRLSQTGVVCEFATNEQNTAILQQAGFTAHGVVPSPKDILAEAGIEGEAGLSAVRSGTEDLWRAAFPKYAGGCAGLEALIGDADVIVAPTWAYNAQAVAEKRRIPFVGAHLWPTSFLSASDPPVLQGLPSLIKAPQTRVAILWNALLIGIMRRVLKRRYAPIITPIRAAYGLGPLSRVPLFEFQHQPARTLGLVSGLLVPSDPDGHASTVIAGFPKIDDPSDPLAPDVKRFLDDKPIVFSLGSILSSGPGEFYQTSADVARRLGRKALLLMDDPGAIEQCDLVKAVGYVPHAEVFPQASVIVHHGGIGTTARALASGRPQLVVPHFGDQPDNAARLKRLGVADVLTPEAYTSDAAAAALTSLLTTPAYAARAAEAKRRIDQEDGADVAATVIEEVIDTAQAA